MQRKTSCEEREENATKIFKKIENFWRRKRLTTNNLDNMTKGKKRQGKRKKEIDPRKKKKPGVHSSKGSESTDFITINFIVSPALRCSPFLRPPPAGIAVVQVIIWGAEE